MLMSSVTRLKRGRVLSVIITLIYYKITGLKPKEKKENIGEEVAA